MGDLESEPNVEVGFASFESPKQSALHPTAEINEFGETENPKQDLEYSSTTEKSKGRISSEEIQDKLTPANNGSSDMHINGYDLNGVTEKELDEDFAIDDIPPTPDADRDIDYTFRGKVRVYDAILSRGSKYLYTMPMYSDEVYSNITVE